MQRLLTDTNVWIDWLNEGRFGDILLAKGVLKHLSAVVLMELEAGAFSRQEQRMISQLARAFETRDRLVIPTSTDYREAGRILRRLQAEKGYELNKAYWLANDVLIALSARGVGATVLTQNAKDFEAIRQYLSFPLLIV